MRDATPSWTGGDTKPSQGGAAPSGGDVMAQVCSVLTNQVRLEAPRCDFPEFQERLDKLVSRFPAVFAASGSDVGKSKGEEVKLVL